MMMDPVLFLDIDGVLNSEGWLTRFEGRTLGLPADAVEMLDPAAVGRLDRIQRETGCAIVVSSSWRHHLALDLLDRLLRGHGLRGSLHDRTPPGRSRTAEIVAWLRGHGGLSRLHAALEDEPDEGAEHFSSVRWVVTSFSAGLTDADTERAIAMLSSPR